MRIRDYAGPDGRNKAEEQMQRAMNTFQGDSIKRTEAKALFE